MEEYKQPEEKPGKVVMSKYAVNKKKTAIVQTWEYIDEPEERLRMGCLVARFYKKNR